MRLTSTVGGAGKNRFDRWACLTTIAAGWLILVLGLAAGPAIGGELSDRKQFAKLIYAGSFDQAHKFISTRPAEVVGEDIKQLEEALAKYSRLDTLRKEAKAQSYQEMVTKAKDYLSEGKVEKALSSAQKARAYVEDGQEKAFGDQEWIKQIVAEALIRAEKHLSDHEWLEVGTIYAELAAIYPDRKEYEKKAQEYAKRVRVEAIYALKGDSPDQPSGDWADQLKRINVDNVMTEVTPRIQALYVEQPDMRALALAGLESVTIFVESEKLQEVFSVLADKEKRKKFDEGIDNLIGTIRTDKKSEFTYQDFWRTFTLLRYLNQNTLELREELLIREFLDGALPKLDRFSGMIWPYEMDYFRKHTTGKFEGVGILITMKNNKLTVVTPIPGTPAYRAAIVPQDRIVTINGEPTKNITINQAVQKITGPRGTKVVLGILHTWADEPVDVVLIRDKIVIHTVKGVRLSADDNWEYFADKAKQIAYVRVTSFTREMVAKLRTVLEQVREEGARGLILDLRFNPGGTLTSAVQTADLFLSKGRIVSTKGRNPATARQEPASPGGVWVDLPIIVLISNYSASASEIVCGALQDHHRALVIGERSFGKGSVQNVIPIDEQNCNLKLTTAYYYLPSGRCLHKVPDAKEWGVDPDVKIKLMPLELFDLIKLQRDSEIAKRNGPNAKTRPVATSPATSQPTTKPTTKPARKYPPTDVQLEAALLVMRTRLACEYPWQLAAEKTAPSQPGGVAVGTEN